MLLSIKNGGYINKLFKIFGAFSFSFSINCGAGEMFEIGALFGLFGLSTNPASLGATPRQVGFELGLNWL
jgi:hypothetical protein